MATREPPSSPPGFVPGDSDSEYPEIVTSWRDGPPGPVVESAGTSDDPRTPRRDSSGDGDYDDDNSTIDYLDSIGYDNGDDDCDGYDPDDNRGFQNGVFDNIIF